MAGEPIDQLNAGLQSYRQQITANLLAARRVEIALFTFGGSVQLEQQFVTARAFNPPTLSTNGNTPMSEAVIRSIKHLEDRKAEYRTNGIAFYRPWIFLITDGEPTDPPEQWKLACDAVRLGEEQKKFVLFPVGTSTANFAKLGEIAQSVKPLQLKGLAFGEFFRWLSNSQSRVSQSQIGSQVQLPPATGNDGWAVAPT